MLSSRGLLRMSPHFLYRCTDLCKHTLQVLPGITSPVTIFIHEHDQILSLSALHSNSRTKEKNEQKLCKFTPDKLKPDREGGVQENNPTFEGCITGKVAVVLHVRKCRPQKARSIQKDKVRRMGPRMEHLVELC
jgi:hypothetical protein